MASTLTFELRRVDGTPADPPTFQTVAPLWRPGDTIPLGRRTLRVIGVRHAEDIDRTTVLIVEDMSRCASSPDSARVVGSCAEVAFRARLCGWSPAKEISPSLSTRLTPTGVCRKFF